jgi:SAM-dependent methyltransferase
VEAREEFEAHLVMARRVDELSCTVVGDALAQVRPGRTRGLVLLTPHFDSFFLGIAFLGQTGARISPLSSAITHDPRVEPAVRDYFTRKYQGLAAYLNGGSVMDMERGLKPFYRMLNNAETVIVLADAPRLPHGVPMDVDFLGERRVLAGGALRMAQHTDSDLGGFVCRHRGGGHYELALSVIGPARDPSTVAQVYDFFSHAILADPGRWWASDLLPDMPAAVTPNPPPVAAAPHAVLVLPDSPLQGSGELACGLRELRRDLGTALPPGLWIDTPASPAEVLRDCPAPRLLVLLHPALLVTADLAALLGQCLAEPGTDCAVATSQRHTEGEWIPSYTTRVDFERYVQRRSALALGAPVPQGSLQAYLVDVAAARSIVESRPDLDWRALPGAFGPRGRQALRAYVHDYGDYQQGSREEMIDLLPAGTRRLLDIGGGEGGFALACARRLGLQACVVEPVPHAAQVARSQGLQVLEQPIETLDPAGLDPFDAISLLDVLEHLDDPLAALLQARRFLAPGGVVLISVPNVGHWSVVRDLAAGRFDYQPVGILCQTHRRFFTERSLRQLLDDAGLSVRQLRRQEAPLPPDFTELVPRLQQAGLACDEASLRTESLQLVAGLA